MQTSLWAFPESDFDEWRGLVGSPQVSTYGEYMTLLSAVQADLERSGHKVERVVLTVKEMKAELTRLGLKNTPNNRAAVVGLRSSE